MIDPEEAQKQVDALDALLAAVGNRITVPCAGDRARFMLKKANELLEAAEKQEPLKQ